MGYFFIISLRNGTADVAQWTAGTVTGWKKWSATLDGVVFSAEITKFGSASKVSLSLHRINEI